MPIPGRDDTLADTEVLTGPVLPRATRAGRRRSAWPGGRLVRRTVIAAAGAVLVLAGLIMLVTPGPGWLAIFAGLAVWGREFSWAHRLSHWARRRAARGWQRVRATRRARA